VFAFAGAAPTVAAQQARGGVWARYEQDFSTFAEQHWRWAGADNYSANFYDRAMIYYVWWARTGHAPYLERAHQLALNHRAYIEAQSFNPQPFNLMVDGVVLHALLTGDARSATAVQRVAEQYTTPGTYWATVVGNVAEPDLDGRSQARVLGAALGAWYLAPAGASRDAWAARLRPLLTKLLATQGADGAYRFRNQCGQSKPFMTGMMNEALIRYHSLFEADARITPAVQRAVDYLWAHDWVPAASGFRYIGNWCNGDNPEPTADLNNLIVTGFGFVAKMTGDASYVTRGDAVFTGAVQGAWLTGTKQFNQQYTSSYRYLGLRF
jgi:hypothetical protein